MVAFVCVCASTYLDFYRDNSTTREGTGVRIGIRASVCLLLLFVLLATRDPKFVDWIQVWEATAIISYINARTQRKTNSKQQAEEVSEG